MICDTWVVWQGFTIIVQPFITAVFLRFYCQKPGQVKENCPWQNPFKIKQHSIITEIIRKGIREGLKKKLQTWAFGST